MEIHKERITDSINEYWAAEHLHRYAMCIDIVKDKVVLDIASGDGYGSMLLSASAAKVIGVDISSESIYDARKKYLNNNLEFLVGSILNIPLPDSSVDVITSFETLEHVEDHLTIFKEIKRVLKPDGILIISTPDKYYYSDLPKYMNPHHVKELYKDEFYSLIKDNFLFSKKYIQNTFLGSIILNPEELCRLESLTGNYKKVEKLPDIILPLYHIAICSDAPLDNLNAVQSVFSAEKVMGTTIAQLTYDLSESKNTINQIRNSKTYKIAAKFSRLAKKIFK